MDIPGDQGESTLPWVDVDLTYPEPVVGSKTFEKWYSCSKCTLRFPEGKTVLYRGKRYGTECGCSKDIATLAAKGT
jgi:hypothetical protein